MVSQPDGDARRFETSRLLIRRFTSDDWADFQVLATNYNACGGKYEGKWPESDEHARKSVEYIATDGKFFAACLRQTGQIIGFLALNGMDDNKQMDLGYIIHTDYQDGHHDREALETLISHIFAKLGASSIAVRWVPEWTQQFAVSKALGFTPVGNEEGQMQLTRQQWEQSRTE
ncbi:MAG: GNAT family N-acetyltransferase [Candidatus Latescibacteria bacterium]|jgi:RimJ/RimL family protein N-acetyltransferase|nr:GNAT family N-acetyltransferase [Candidatus Latescibacterota bacterium]